MVKEKFPIKTYSKIDDEYIKIVKPILQNKEFIERLNFHHHDLRSVYSHSLIVSIRSYYIAKKLGLNYEAAAIAGLLHDFYRYDWQLTKRTGPIWKAHGFIHANDALCHAKALFPELIDKKIENAIKRHMFPLNIIPPRYFVGWIICSVDKWSSFEIFKRPQNLLKYVGIRKRKEKIYE